MLNKITAIIKQSIGLDPNSVGETAIRHAVLERMKRLKIDNALDYENYLLNDPKEISYLTDTVVVPETWFFRNVSSFTALKKYLSKNSRVRENSHPLKILCLPCSSGEEAYSIAMVLNELGIDKQAAVINANDVSAKLIRKARQGLYGPQSFREETNSLLNKYFRAIGDQFEIDDELKKSINFSVANCLDESFLSDREYYDIIFCRNLLIYFDRNTQSMLLDKLTNSLKENGLLVMGHADTAQIDMTRFRKTDETQAFTYIKLGKIASLPECDNKSKRTPDKPGYLTCSVAIGKPLNTKINKSISKLNQKTKIYNDDYQNEPHKNIENLNIRLIERLANAGDFLQAKKMCDQYLEHHPQSAQAYYLLGLISDSTGKSTEAEQLLRKAIYLDPNHEHALVLSALIATKNGDSKSAKSLRRRALRVSRRMGI